MAKARLLCVNEFSGLASGYGTLSYELLGRLHSMGYEVVEYACYLKQSDERRMGVPWRVIPSTPLPHEEAEFHSNQLNQFGAFKFEQTVLEVKPDTVIAQRDPWMDEFVYNSPLRRFYRLVGLAPVDSRPQRAEWLEMYSRADAIFTYTDWGKKVLDEESGGRIPTVGPASVGIEQCFQPVGSRAQHKLAYNLDPNSLIVGMVSRNQFRKLFPDLMYAFARFLREAPAELARRAFLLFHTSYPDIHGWDIPVHLRDAGVMSKTLFTYKCRNCQNVFVSNFQDARTVCPCCGQYCANLPSTDNGISREELAGIYNLLDVHVQYAVCEGFGLAQAEAAACGVPILSTNYSAMEDVVERAEGHPIKVEGWYCDPGLGMWRARPDEADLTRALIEILSLPEEVRRHRGLRATQGIRKHYDYHSSAERWASVIDQLPALNRWNEPPYLVPEGLEVPDHVRNNFSAADLVRWCLVNVSGRPDLADTQLAHRMTRNLEWGSTDAPKGGFYCPEHAAIGMGSHVHEYNPDHLIEECREIARKNNFWERRRCGI